MKYLSLFTGIGGFELGIQQAYENKNKQWPVSTSHPRRDLSDSDSRMGGESEQRSICIGYSEIDKYATQIYQKHFPNHKNYGDITKIEADNIPDVDFLFGGFPCQAFSIAGKRKGFEDTRGTLFFDIARILKAKRPRLLLLENVKGLLSHDNGDTFKTIISTLDELGYDLQWQVLNSKNFGVPQNRERVFIVGHLRGTRRPEVFPFGGANQEDTISIRDESQGQEVSGIATRHLGRNGGLKSDIASTVQVAEVPHIVKVPEATSKGYAEAEVGDSINLSVPNSKTRRGRVGKGIAQTLDTGMQQHTLSSDMQIRRLTPIECERLQGFPDGWTEHGVGEAILGMANLAYMGNGKIRTDISDTQRYKCLGNAVTVNVIQAIMEKLL